MMMMKTNSVLVVLLMGLVLCACAPSTPAATPTPADTPTLEPTPTPFYIRLQADGSGDYSTLAEAVEMAPAGATIVLGLGIFQVDEPLDIGKPISLLGVGIEESAIVCEAEGYVVRFIGDGPFVAEGITFLHGGEKEGDAVIVESGVVDFNHCRFAGAVSTQDESTGVGLRLLGDTTGVVQNSVATRNDSAGILVGGQARPRLEGNSCSDNQGIGIAYLDSGGGVAHNNRCLRNMAGIHVAQQAQPTLEENLCGANQWDGIAYWDQAGGVARRNQSLQNEQMGIHVNREAQPMLEGNVCNDNGRVGIAYTGDSGGLAHQNQCSGNQMHGILVGDQAQPRLGNNDCADNRQVGIAFFDSAGGEARQNECANNGIAGIYVAETANPDLMDNYCHDNGEEEVRDLRP
ncbi:MAG: hypothetical protein DRI48_07405 [Chloroflexi bacterium]|nr:MAG: hypothetical protein DRI48_07405 [Chloroflexota bacterium]